MTAPAVSVILPTHNRAALLERSLGSVLAQTWRDLEVVVVDDGSTEDVAGAVARVAGKDPRVRLVRLPERRGGAGARNAGLAAARAPIVAFQDSDDEWLPEKLARQVEQLEASGADVAYCAFWRLDGARRTRYPKEPGQVPQGDLHRFLLEKNIITTAAAVARRAALDAAGGFDASMPRYQDWDLWIRVARRGRFAFLDEPLLVQYHQPDSISANDDARVTARLRLLEKYRADMALYPGVRARQCEEVARLLDMVGRLDQARRLRREALWSRVRDRLGLRRRRA